MPTAGLIHDELKRLAGAASVEGLLALVRQHLDVDAAFVAEFDNGDRVVRHAVAGAGPSLVGRRDPLGETFCWKMGSGEVEPVVCDVAAHPVLAPLPIRTELRIASYGAAPITLSDGSLFGTLCVLGHRPDPTLDERDARFLRLVAALIADQLERELQQRAADLAELGQVRDALAAGGPDVVFQPIVDLTTGAVGGYEALARFSHGPVRSPDAWFAVAARIGLGVDLELMALRRALAAVDRLPAGAYLSVNVGAATFCSHELPAALGDVDPGRLVLELTEHEVLADLDRARAARRRLRRLGSRVAIDDVGSGYAGLAQLLALSPDVAKLDRAIVTGVHHDPARRALVGAAAAVAAVMGGVLVAEGVETRRDLDAVRKLGVGFGQGYVLGHPGPLPAEPGASAP